MSRLVHNVNNSGLLSGENDSSKLAAKMNTMTASTLHHKMTNRKSQNTGLILVNRPQIYFSTKMIIASVVSLKMQFSQCMGTTEIQKNKYRWWFGSRDSQAAYYKSTQHTFFYQKLNMSRTKDCPQGCVFKCKTTAFSHTTSKPETTKYNICKALVKHNQLQATILKQHRRHFKQALIMLSSS